MPGVPMPVVLRKDDHLLLAVYDESKKDCATGAIVELDGPGHTRYAGDYRECEVRFNPAQPTCFAHASTTHLRYSEVVGVAEGDTFELRTLFEIEMPHVVVNLAFSPRGNWLLAHACMDSKRTPDGNMSVFDTATGKMVRRVMQARWPAMAWSSDEEYAVRPVQGWMHVIDGDMAKAGAVATTTITEESEADGSSSSGAPSGILSKMDLMLAQDKEIDFSLSPKEGLPIMALFKPFYKNRPGTFSLYRLPHLNEGPLYQVQFGRAEAATIMWSHTGNHIALLVKSERDPSGKSYYGSVTLHLIDVMNRRITDVKFKGDDGATVHDCQWSPTGTDELLVVHDKMPRNKTTLLNKSGVALMTFGEAPRNMCLWAPNGKGFVLGGSGNLAGDYQFYTYSPGSLVAAASAGAKASAPTAACVGEFNDKCSFHTWAPDSHCFMCATVFTRLRMSNRTAFFKNNGERIATAKFDVLYGAHWVRMKEASEYPERPASPRPVVAEKEKPLAYKPPGGTSRAAAMLRAPDSASAQKPKAGGPVGGTVVVQKKKKKR